MALRIAAQTMIGSAKMVLETGKHPAILRDEVDLNNLFIKHLNVYFILLNCSAFGPANRQLLAIMNWKKLAYETVSSMQ